MQIEEVDIIGITNQAINFIKSHPCAICSRESFCKIKYKGTCRVWIKLKAAFYDVKEVPHE